MTKKEFERFKIFVKTYQGQESHFYLHLQDSEGKTEAERIVDVDFNSVKVNGEYISALNYTGDKLSIHRRKIKRMSLWAGRYNEKAVYFSW